MAENNAPLKDKVVSGLVWIFGERILAQGVSFLVSIILARILMPEEYGIVALVLVFLNIADVFVSNGFGESLVQKQHATETDFSTVFYCSFAFSWLVYAVLFASAGWVADYYANELLCPVLRVLAEGPDLELAAELCDRFAHLAARTDRALSGRCAQEKDK